METEIKVVGKKPKEVWKPWDSFEVGDVLEVQASNARYVILDGNGRGQKELFYTGSVQRCTEYAFTRTRKVGTIKKVTFEMEEE